MFERILTIFHVYWSIHSNDEVAITISNCSTLIGYAKIIRHCKWHKTHNLGYYREKVQIPQKNMLQESYVPTWCLILMMLYFFPFFKKPLRVRIFYYLPGGIRTLPISRSKCANMVLSNRYHAHVESYCWEYLHCIRISTWMTPIPVISNDGREV